MSEVYDHLGNKFSTQKEMCDFYHISTGCFRKRISKGLSLKEALTNEKEKPRARKYKDFNGKEFNSLTDMCKYYGITTSLYFTRLKHGWELKDILTKKKVDYVVRDFNGKEFTSIKKMCAYWNISTTCYWERSRKGWSLKDILTVKVSNQPVKCVGVDGKEYRSLSAMNKAGVAPEKESSYLVYDHLGNKFRSERKMCDYYHIDPGTFYSRRKSGWSLEDALTVSTDKVKQDKICYDFNDKKFSTQKDMCEYYGISTDTYFNRLKRGWSLQDALTKEVNSLQSIIGPDGKKYKSISAMCKVYNIGTCTFLNRVNRGISVEEALTDRGKIIQTCLDYNGKEYKSIRDMCKRYNVSYTVVRRHIQDRYLTDLLKLKNFSDQNFRVLRNLGEGYYSVRLKDKEDVWTKEEIVRYTESV